ncbi:hypothetical protein MXB_3146 [Myxobolus squamalis]|nr:hypothetical protein MXB_3146 [Myxobolus squamalis]
MKDKFVHNENAQLKESSKLEGKFKNFNQKEVKHIELREDKNLKNPKIGLVSPNTKIYEPSVKYGFPVQNFSKPSRITSSLPENLLMPPISSIFPGQTTIETTINSDSQILGHIKPPVISLVKTEIFENCSDSYVISPNEKNVNPLISSVKKAQKIFDSPINCHIPIKKTVEPTPSDTVRTSMFTSPPVRDSDSKKSSITPSTNLLLPDEGIVKSPICSAAKPQKMFDTSIKVDTSNQELAKPQVKNFYEPSSSYTISHNKSYQSEKFKQQNLDKKQEESITKPSMRVTKIEPTSTAGCKIDQDLIQKHKH